MSVVGNHIEPQSLTFCMIYIYRVMFFLSISLFLLYHAMLSQKRHLNRAFHLKKSIVSILNNETKENWFNIIKKNISLSVADAVDSKVR